MIYTKDKNLIKVYDKTQFNIKHILECGQVFRYNCNNGIYCVYSLDKKAVIKEYDEYYEILTDENYVDYFINYFDLNNDYNLIKKELLKLAFDNDILKQAINYGYGIRILKQNLFETIISFIISANNNIKRIQGIIERLCSKLGEKKKDYFAFPTCEALASQNEEFYKTCGAGYRAAYLVETSNFLNKSFDYDNYFNLPTDIARKKLLSLKGVGGKVADCILLFGINDFNVFPVDTWIEKVYYDIFPKEKINREKIRKNLTDYFGNLSGYAQQYLFYYKRES